MNQSTTEQDLEEGSGGLREGANLVEANTAVVNESPSGARPRTSTSMPNPEFDNTMLEIERNRCLLESRWGEAVCARLPSVCVERSDSPQPNVADTEVLRLGPYRRTPTDASVTINAPVDVGSCSAIINQEPASPRCVHSLPRFQLGDVPCHFTRRPVQVLVVKRLFSAEVAVDAAHVCNFLSKDRGIRVLVEKKDLKELNDLGAEEIHIFDEEANTQLPAGFIDFVIALGGDGTLLWVSHLFPNAVPPVLSVFMGSLGYLAQFPSDNLTELIDSVINEKFIVQLRNRIRACVIDEEGEEVGEYAAMNDCVFDRGGCSQLTSLEVYCNNRYFTTVTADGLIIATPSGSTAYSMSSGGSMVHPKVPCMLFTPICPHSLSFRPAILPDSVTLKILNPRASRTTAWLSIDGKNRSEIRKGMSVIVTMSAFPLPLIVAKDAEDDPWLTSLKRILNWNQRIRYSVFSPHVAASRKAQENGVDSPSALSSDSDRWSGGRK